MLKYYVLPGLRCLTSDSAIYWLCVFKQVVNPSEPQTFQVKLANKANGEALSQGNYQRVDRRVNNQSHMKICSKSGITKVAPYSKGIRGVHCAGDSSLKNTVLGKLLPLHDNVEVNAELCEVEH